MRVKGNKITGYYQNDNGFSTLSYLLTAPLDGITIKMTWIYIHFLPTLYQISLVIQCILHVMKHFAPYSWIVLQDQKQTSQIWHTLLKPLLPQFTLCRY